MSSSSLKLKKNVFQYIYVFFSLSDSTQKITCYRRVSCNIIKVNYFLVIIFFVFTGCRFWSTFRRILINSRIAKPTPHKLYYLEFDCHRLDIDYYINANVEDNISNVLMIDVLQGLVFIAYHHYVSVGFLTRTQLDTRQ